MKHRAGQAPDQHDQHGDDKSPVTADRPGSFVSQGGEKFAHTILRLARRLVYLSDRDTAAAVRQTCNRAAARESQFTGATEVPTRTASGAAPAAQASERVGRRRLTNVASV